jgi:hypothetical protein
MIHWILKLFRKRSKALPYEQRWKTIQPNQPGRL